MKEKRKIAYEVNWGTSTLKIKTKYGTLSVDIENGDLNGQDSGNISFFPDGADGDGFDICRVLVGEDGTLKILTFADPSVEVETSTDYITKEDIDQAFYLGKYADREEPEKTLSFKHINDVRNWLSKAKNLDDLNLRIGDIPRKFGTIFTGEESDDGCNVYITDDDDEISFFVYFEVQE